MSALATTLRHELGAGVVVAHPGRQHAHQSVLAAQEVGGLLAFATSLFVAPGSGPQRVGRVLAGTGVGRAVLRAGHDEIDSSKVVQFPVSTTAAKLLGKLPRAEGLQSWANDATDAAIARWLRRLPVAPAVVHGFEGSCLATLQAARERGCVTVLDVACAHEYAVLAGDPHAFDGATPARTQRVRAERVLADVLVAPSEFVVTCLAEYGDAASRAVVVPFGADPLAPARADRAGDPFRVLFVGNAGRRKGVGDLLEAWQRAALPDAELVIVGSVPRDADVTGVRWLGVLPHEETRAWFARSDVFVLPSLAEGSALVTYEAMAAGVPVVTTRNSGSVVRDAVDGFIVPAGDPGELARRLADLHADPERRRAMGESARARIAGGFTWSDYRARIRAVWSDAIAGRKA